MTWFIFHLTKYCCLIHPAGDQTKICLPASGCDKALHGMLLILIINTLSSSLSISLSVTTSNFSPFKFKLIEMFLVLKFKIQNNFSCSCYPSTEWRRWYSDCNDDDESVFWTWYSGMGLQWIAEDKYCDIVTCNELSFQWMYQGHPVCTLTVYSCHLAGNSPLVKPELL